jgi:4-phosphopantoate--beta-alanine ligase
MGKTEVVVDLNPMSRSAQVAAIPIVDNVIRAVPNVTRHARELTGASRADLQAVVDDFDPEAARRAAERAIREGELD